MFSSSSASLVAFEDYLNDSSLVWAIGHCYSMGGYYSHSWSAFEVYSIYAADAFSVGELIFFPFCLNIVEFEC